MFTPVCSLQLHTRDIWPGFKLFPAEVSDAMGTWKLVPQDPSYLPCPPLPHRPWPDTYKKRFSIM